MKQNKTNNFFFLKSVASSTNEDHGYGILIKRQGAEPNPHGLEGKEIWKEKDQTKKLFVFIIIILKFLFFYIATAKI